MAASNGLGQWLLLMAMSQCACALCWLQQHFLATLSCTVNTQGVRPLAMRLRLCCGGTAGCAQVNGMQLADKIVYVGPFLKRTDRSPTDSKYTNVYVKNLSEDVDDEALEKLAAEYGEVVSAIIMKVGVPLPSSGATVIRGNCEGHGNAIAAITSLWEVCQHVQCLDLPLVRVLQLTTIEYPAVVICIRTFYCDFMFKSVAASCC